MGHHFLGLAQDADDDSIPSHPQRYGFACPNSPYRDHTFACSRELDWLVILNPST